MSLENNTIDSTRLADDLLQHDFVSSEQLEREKISHDDAVLTKLIKDDILKAGDELRANFPWLVKHQDAIGMGIFAVSCSAIALTASAYIGGFISPWLAIPIAAFFMSLLHELEHDLIHLMYFRKNRFWNNFMLLGVWLFRPSTINPFVRRRLHIHHHKFSGTESDLEERGITNGVSWGLKRLVMTGDNILSIVLRPLETRKMVKAFLNNQGNITPEEKRKIANENIHGYFPMGTINYTIWHGFIAYHVANWLIGLMGFSIPLNSLGQSILHLATIWVVCLSAPNALRTFCLHFVSSNMHYYGDVEPGNVIEQCQVWTAKWLIPLHAFCFNFGGTHAIHHFVVRDPFYIRQAIASKVYPVMKKHGVRFNDFGTFARANRRGDKLKA